MVVVLSWAVSCRAQQGPRETAELILPDAPEPQTASSSPSPRRNPCSSLDEANGARKRKPGQPQPVLGPEPRTILGGGRDLEPAAIPCTQRKLNGLETFLNGPAADALTPRDKAWLAARNIADPFNLITIAGEAALGIAIDSHSPYGPGMPGYGRYMGVSFAQDLTGEFFGTFLIPSVAHQDPHYHRMPERSVPRRTVHAIGQIFWSQSDTGRGMPNYANLLGFAVDDGISNLYVPGRKTDVEATGRRYVIALATAPVGNLISEFLPDVASHIHVQIVLLQRVINQVARSGMSSGPPALTEQ